jgi:hypothetical protein
VKRRALLPSVKVKSRVEGYKGEEEGSLAWTREGSRE